jgi:hypothetical protein
MISQHRSATTHADIRPHEDHQQAQTLKLQKLREAIQAGEESGASIDATLVFNQLESRYKSAASTLDTQQGG